MHVVNLLRVCEPGLTWASGSPSLPAGLATRYSLGIVALPITKNRRGFSPTANISRFCFLDTGQAKLAGVSRPPDSKSALTKCPSVGFPPTGTLARGKVEAPSREAPSDAKRRGGVRTPRLPEPQHLLAMLSRVAAKRRGVSAGWSHREGATDHASKFDGKSRFTAAGMLAGGKSLRGFRRLTGAILLHCPRAVSSQYPSPAAPYGVTGYTKQRPDSRRSGSPPTLHAPAQRRHDAAGGQYRSVPALSRGVQRVGEALLRRNQGVASSRRRARWFAGEGYWLLTAVSLRAVLTMRPSIAPIVAV